MKKIYSFTLFLFSLTLFSQTIGLQQFATGFSSPLAIVRANDSRLFVVQRGGLIRVLNANGTINATPFLTLTSATIVSGGERGLLGLAFHPNYATNGLFYINYTRASDGATVIAKYTVSADANVANAASAEILLTIPQPYSNHNGGSLVFGPDGFLYIGMGDGGSGGDPQFYAQNINSLLGKMLRIDVNVPTGYAIPPTNPYAGAIAGADEIWAVGMRNPWKFSFDKTTGDLWIADVGQNVSEEINKAASTDAGLNYGWRCYEGNTVYNTTVNCSILPIFKFPITTYALYVNNRCSSTGGYSYRGMVYPNFQNKYFFADYCSNEIGWISTAGSAITWSTPFTGGIATFGEDSNGEIYVAGLSNGIVYKMVDTSLNTNDFQKNGLSLSPNPAKNLFTLKNDNQLNLSQINIYDLTGKLVLTQKINSAIELIVPIQNLNSGLYVVNVEDKDGNNFKSKLMVN